MTSRPRRRFWLKLTAGLLFAVLAYGSAYLALVTPGMSWGGLPRAPAYVVPGYGTAPLEVVFAPAHWIDRRVRPSIWKGAEVPVDTMTFGREQ